MGPDVNVLAAAWRANHPHHAVARGWLEEAVKASEAGAAFTLMPMVLASFLRLVISPKIFRQATPIEDAMGFVDALLASPGVQLAHVGSEWSKLRQLCLEKHLCGNDVPDAWLSAAVAQMGEHLVSFDRDFRKLLTRGRSRCSYPRVAESQRDRSRLSACDENPRSAQEADWSGCVPNDRLLKTGCSRSRPCHRTSAPAAS